MFHVNRLPNRRFTWNIKSYFFLKNNGDIFNTVVCCRFDWRHRAMRKSDKNKNGWVAPPECIFVHSEKVSNVTYEQRIPRYCVGDLIDLLMSMQSLACSNKNLIISDWHKSKTIYCMRLFTAPKRAINLFTSFNLTLMIFFKVSYCHKLSGFLV